MSGAELRDLLERVEAHGSVPGLSMDHSPMWAVSQEGALTFSPAGVARHAWLADHLVGVVKRDLIERGHRVDLILNGPQGIDLAYTGQYGKQLHVGKGDSELEAVLRAWLAAAEAEGWTA